MKESTNQTLLEDQLARKDKEILLLRTTLEALEQNCNALIDAVCLLARNWWNTDQGNWWDTDQGTLVDAHSLARVADKLKEIAAGERVIQKDPA